MYSGKPAPRADHESVDIRPPSQPIPRIVERPTGIYVPRVGRSLNRPSADKVEVLLNLHQRAPITECELLLGHAPIEPTQTDDKPSLEWSYGRDEDPVKLSN